MLKITANELIKAVDGTLINGDLFKYGKDVINDVSYDSRIVGENILFVPIVGENVDPHKFIAKMLETTDCIVSLTERDIEYSGDKLLIKVDNSTKAVQKLAQIYRETIKVPVIGITGSVGKTTTRQFITLALSAEKNVYATPGNKNSQIGTPQALFEFNDNADIAVLEMGMSMPGEMSRLANMVRPDAVVFTNIGITHIENLGSREAILNEKSHILDFAKKGTKIFLNKDNDLLNSFKPNNDFDIVSYGLNDNYSAYAKDIQIEEGLPSFVAVINEKEVSVSLNVYGNHNIYNALVALLVADSYDIDLNKASCKLSEYTGFSHRNQIIRTKNIAIIDDTYNAAPDSMKAALDMLSAIKCEGKRIAVLADMKELGDIANKEHIKIGRYAKDKGNIELVLTYGELAKLISDSFCGNKKYHYSTHKELEQALFNLIKPGDLVLFKGSNSMKLFDIVDKVANHEFM